MVEVNYLALLAVAVVQMVVGTLWYGPIFGKKWIALMKFTPEDMASAHSKGMGKTYALAFVGSLLTSFVLWKMIVYATGFMQQSGALFGAQVGFWLWLGIALPITLSTVLWEGRSWSLWCLNVTQYLVTFVICGAILGAWM